ncbi:13358_t:CDS:2, partial [Funneliformis caledonium]
VYISLHDLQFYICLSHCKPDADCKPEDYYPKHHPLRYIRSWIWNEDRWEHRGVDIAFKNIPFSGMILGATACACVHTSESVLRQLCRLENPEHFQGDGDLAKEVIRTYAWKVMTVPSMQHNIKFINEIGIGTDIQSFCALFLTTTNAIGSVIAWYKWQKFAESLGVATLMCIRRMWSYSNHRALLLQMPQRLFRNLWTGVWYWWNI